MTWNSLAKFVLGVSLAIAIMIGGSVVIALYFMYKVTSHPPKPVFANEKVAKKVQKASTNKTTQPPSPPAKQANTQPTPSVNSSPSSLEPGAYKARVIWEQGLSLRTEPSLDGERTKTLDYNQQIVVLAESADKNWQKVRLADSEQEGWIKAGNIERVQEAQ
jgi:hypothetical protein